MNQKVSEKQSVNEPTTELPSIAISLSVVSSVYDSTIFFKIIVDDQNKNKIVKALEITEIILTIKAICILLNANIDKNAPII